MILATMTRTSSSGNGVRFTDGQGDLLRQNAFHPGDQVTTMGVPPIDGDVLALPAMRRKIPASESAKNRRHASPRTRRLESSSPRRRSKRKEPEKLIGGPRANQRTQVWNWMRYAMAGADDDPESSPMTRPSRRLESASSNRAPEVHDEASGRDRAQRSCSGMQRDAG